MSQSTGHVFWWHHMHSASLGLFPYGEPAPLPVHWFAICTQRERFPLLHLFHLNNPIWPHNWSIAILLHGRSCVQFQHWIHRLHRCMCVMCCLLMSCMVQCECWMHMSSQLVCSLIPFTPYLVPPLPGWAPPLLPNSLLQDGCSLTCLLYGVWYIPPTHCKTAPRCVCVCVCVCVWTFLQYHDTATNCAL